MSGTSEGNKKGAATAKQRYGKDFHKKVGAKSWSDPSRSRKVGFALNPELAKQAGRLGGLKNKKDKSEENEEYLTAEEIAAIAETEEDGTGPL